MCKTVAEARAHALALLLGGCTPEEVEQALEGPARCILERTALSDPTNVLMQEVTGDGTADSARPR